MKNKIISISFVIVVFSYFLISLITPDKGISYEERRKLKQKPKISFATSLSDEIENYLLDQFPMRNTFRSIKSYTDLNLFRKTETNNYFNINNNIYKNEYPLKEKEVNSFIAKINYIYDNYLTNMNVYYTIIPDKNYFLDNKYLKIDYDNFYNTLTTNLNQNMQYINIKDALTIDDYYRTDIHWKQENLLKIVDIMSKAIYFDYSNNYEVKSYYPFYGAHYGGLSLNIKPDELKYLTNEYTINADVFDIENKVNNVYMTSLLGKIDSYEVFLGGATPLITINNPLRTNNKELIIIRDSFGSSLAPLLISGYSKITLIDFRYLNSKLLTDYVNFTNQDVLIMYSTLIINNSNSIKITY